MYFSLLKPTSHLLETKRPHSKVNIKQYFDFKKPPWNLFLHAEI
jgi:hypothetical protein